MNDLKTTAMQSMFNSFILVCILTQSVSAEEWKSADGVISVTVPDQSRFVQTESQPPASIIWASTDETLSLMVAEVQIPPNIPLRQSSLEEGITEELGGQILDSTSELHKGHELFTITNSSQIFEPELIMTQKIIAINNKAYKLMAMGFGKDVRTDPEAVKFLSSLKLHITEQKKTESPPNRGSGLRAAREETEITPADLISQKLWGFAFLLLFICGLAKLILRSSKQEKPTDNSSA
ncbi:MAG: hypothetical protein KDA74_09305 [Planctomycetaceae bacterium]|nr:hypothetical protein [Planctomycetaceae bacterium]